MKWVALLLAKGARKVRIQANQFMWDTVAEMLESRSKYVDLTDARRFDWRHYIANLSDSAQELLGSTGRIKWFTVGIHKTALHQFPVDFGKNLVINS